MAKVIRQTEVLSAVAGLLNKEFDCRVYFDEVLEAFNKPCFFIKFTSVNEPQTVNFTSKQLSVILTYFPRDTDRKELHYLDVFDRVQQLFQLGLQLSERYIHTDSISENRVGEEQDILQITVDFAYNDRIIVAKPEAEIMEEMEVDVKVNESEETIWHS